MISRNLETQSRPLGQRVGDLQVTGQLCKNWLRRGHGTELHSSKVKGCFLRRSGQGPCQ